MEDRASLASSTSGLGPDSPPRAQLDLPPYCFPFEDLRNNPIGFGNIGKPLNGMNLNELVVQSQWPPSVFFGNIANNRILNTKTANDVWDEIASSPMEMINHPQVNAPLGETNMFGDLLLHASVANGLGVQEDPIHPQPVIPIDQMSMVSEQQADLAQLHVGFDISHIGNPVPVPDICSASPDSMSSAAGDVNKSRLREETKDRTIERRQRRMIKNRESAARSRAKKQAYANDLEKKVRWLNNMNKWLKKAMELRLSSKTTPKQRQELRRTSSAPPSFDFQST